MTTRDELAKVIYKARWVDGIKDIAKATDAAIAAAVLAHLEAEAAATAKELAVVHSPNCCSLLPFERLECCCQYEEGHA